MAPLSLPGPNAATYHFCSSSSSSCCVQARKELRDLSGQDEGKRLDDILGSVGLGGWSDQLKDLRLGG